MDNDGRFQNKPDALRSVSVHEAGHAVVALAHGIYLLRAEINVFKVGNHWEAGGSLN